MSSPIMRGKRTSAEQMDLLVNLLTANPILVNGKCHPSNYKQAEQAWEQAATALNNVRGARKDHEQWKKFFGEWKSKTRKRAREHKQSLLKTGGGGSVNIALTDTENKLLGILGWVAVTGCENLPPDVIPGTSQQDVTVPPPAVGDESLIPVTAIPNVELELEQIEPTPKQGTSALEPVSPEEENAPQNGLGRLQSKMSSKRKRAIPSTTENRLERASKLYATSATKASQSTADLAQSNLELAQSNLALARSQSELARSVSEMATAISLLSQNIGEFL